MKKNGKIICQKQYVNQVISACDSIVPKDETAFIILKGAFKEYLICTDKMVYIVKSGFMTGHTFGKGDLKMPYSNITNAEVNYNLLSGYFELSSGGLQNKKYDYWSNNSVTDPKKQPNVISITGKEDAELFRKAARYIMGRAESKNSSVSNADELTKYANLLKQGLITRAEYENQKKKILNG